VNEKGRDAILEILVYFDAAALRLQADTTKKKNKAKRDFTKQLVKAIAEKRQSQKSPADKAAAGRKKLQS